MSEERIDQPHASIFFLYCLYDSIGGSTCSTEGGVNCGSILKDSLLLLVELYILCVCELPL